MAIDPPPLTATAAVLPSVVRRANSQLEVIPARRRYAATRYGRGGESGDWSVEPAAIMDSAHSLHNEVGNGRRGSQ